MTSTFDTSIAGRSMPIPYVPAVPPTDFDSPSQRPIGTWVPPLPAFAWTPKEPLSAMRRTRSAAAQLQDDALPRKLSGAISGIRRSHSSSAFSRLRKLEQSNRSSTPITKRQALIEAVVLALHKIMLGEATRCAMHKYIFFIATQLGLPDSCIVALLIYVLRAVQDGSFHLSARTWQPLFLSAFVVAAKVSFDEPVWNEDFVERLRISNVNTAQISRWEADFLQLIKFNTNIDLDQYAAQCFALQQSYYEAAHSAACSCSPFVCHARGA